MRDESKQPVVTLKLTTSTDKKKLKEQHCQYDRRLESAVLCYR